MKREEKSVTPLPKVNVPPPPSAIHPQADEEEGEDVAAASLPEPPIRSKIEWDAHFTAAVIVLIVIVNLSLAWILSAEEEEPVYITELESLPEPLPPPPAEPGAQPEAQPETLGTLQPAAGEGERSTTTYISRDERARLLEQLRRTNRATGAKREEFRQPSHGIERYGTQ